jgi:putative Mg2+ transporter-C (MgtC) family protein
MIAFAPQGGLSAMVDVLRLELASKLALAVLAGGAIGLERQIAGKPAGLRTNILICVGSALLMELSLNIGTMFGGARLGDPARLAAQVVTGIGFIGAGTIMQSRGAITGLTSAATLWVVAAIGLTIGAGFYVDALGATATVMVVLAGLGPLEHRLLRARRVMLATIRTKRAYSLDQLREALFASGLSVSAVEQFDHADDRVFELRLRGPARQFDIARSSLLDIDEILNVNFD